VHILFLFFSLGTLLRDCYVHELFHFQSTFSCDCYLLPIDEEWNERLQILRDARNLAKVADFFLNPHKSVVTWDPCACGRNYFSRPSAEEYEDESDAEQRELILQEMKQLKQLAVDYMHPEKPVVTSDAFGCARNYFDRPSAEPTCSPEEAEEQARILADAKQLKQLAVDYMHPEKPVKTTHPCACGRNYFTRPSAVEYEDEEAAQDRELVLEDMKHLKQLAVDYLHPEKPVVTSDPFACGRNFFSRPSAEEYEAKDEEKGLILEEMKQLKKLAVDYLHPEKPVVTLDPCATGRNYFARASATEQVSHEVSEEQARIFQDMAQLKKLSTDYMHPERPIESTGGARNYFDRASASGHADHIHSRGYAIDHSANYPYAYHDHVLDLVHHEHGDDDSHQSEHFEMDEDALQTFRDNLHSIEFFNGQHPKEGVVGKDEEEGGHLSRSPSSVMLFDLATM
jgi:hypothetical protein